MCRPARIGNSPLVMPDALDRDATAVTPKATARLIPGTRCPIMMEARTLPKDEAADVFNTNLLVFPFER